MKLLVFTLLVTVAAVVTQSAGRPSDIVMGSVSPHSVSVSKFGASDVQSHSVNNNGVQQTLRTWSHFEQKPDGSCVKKMTEERNGVPVTKEVHISCVDAKLETDRKGIKINMDTQRTGDNIRKEIAKNEKQMEDNMKNVFGSGFQGSSLQNQAKSHRDLIGEIRQRSLAFGLRHRMLHDTFRRLRANQMGLNGISDMGFSNNNWGHSRQHELAMATHHARIRQMENRLGQQMNFQNTFPMSNLKNRFTLPNPPVSIPHQHNPFDMGRPSNHFPNVLF